MSAEEQTFTVNTDTSTETATDSIENLTPDEQDSLKVGEEIQSQQEQLLAGKYKNAEELEKAYVELQQKLGSNEEEKPAVEEEETTLLTRALGLPPKLGQEVVHAHEASHTPFRAGASTA